MYLEAGPGDVDQESSALCEPCPGDGRSLGRHDSQVLLGPSIPETGRAVLTPGHDGRTVRAEGRGVDGARVTGEERHLLPQPDPEELPDARGLVVARADELRPGGVERH